MIERPFRRRLPGALSKAITRLALACSVATKVLHAQTPADSSGGARSLFDSSHVVVRRLDPSIVAGYGRDFIYEQQDSGPPFWERAMESFWELLQNLIPTGLRPFTHSFLVDLLPYVLIAAAIILLARHWFGHARMTAGGGRGGDLDRGLDGVEEEITSDDLESRLALAIAEGRFRPALRLQYLRALRELSNREILRIARDKTNRDYVRDLSGTELRSPFEELTRFFEYVWYGQIDLDREHFERMRSSFGAFDALLDRRGKR